MKTVHVRPHVQRREQQSLYATVADTYYDEKRREVVREIQGTHEVKGNSLYYFMREPATLIEALENDSLEVVHMTANPELGDAIEIDRHTGRILGRGQRPIAVEFDADEVTNVYKVVPVFYVMPGRIPKRAVIDYYREVGACEVDPKSCDIERIAAFNTSSEVGFVKGWDLRVESEWVNMDEEVSGDLSIAIKRVHIYREPLEDGSYGDDTAEQLRNKLVRLGLPRGKIVIHEGDA